MGGISISGKLTMGVVQDSKAAGYDFNTLKQELLFALETARSRLAIAIAEESKSTLWNQRRYYLDTTDHMRQFIVKLRNDRNERGFSMETLSSALEQLREVSLNDGARYLCGRLRGIVAALE